ncbi:hypothetical protein ACFSLT_31790 [Novosphingobium resinovorum]
MEVLDPQEQKGTVMAGPGPRIGTWVWSPWYAKVWWSCIAVYWAGKAASLYDHGLDDIYTSTAAAYLNLVFMPMMPFLVLGTGFVWACMDYHNLEFGPPSRETMFPETSVGGWSDPMSDPLDPRSPKYWHKSDEH